MSGLREKLFVRQSLARKNEGADEPVEKIASLLRELDGNILEIGPGGGATAAYFKKNIHYKALEPNVYFHDVLRAAFAQNGITGIQIVAGRAASMPFADKSFDAVVAVRSLCSVGDTAAALAEIKRVLKPGGRLVFSEHVGAPKGSMLRLLQMIYRPFGRIFSCGCDLVKDTEFFIRGAGFSDLDIQHFNYSRHFLFRPRIFGSARR